MCGALVALAPLAAGAVHRVPMIAAFGVAMLGLILLAAGLGTQGRTLRIGPGVVLPLALLFIPAVQSIPLPDAVRRALDPNGSALLHENDLMTISAWPLSLDPASTRAHIGRAAAALAVFLVGYHLASGQSRRHLLPRLVAGAGIAAVAIGLGHRILGFSKIYGVLGSTFRSPLVGPFVNSNHTAEFLELGAFACLACSFQRPTALNRVGWMIGTVFCAAGAFATLSRGAIVAMVAGVVMFAFLRYLAKENAGASAKRTSLAWGAFLLGILALGGVALGASQVIDRFKASPVSTDVRFKLWRDSLKVLAAHPAGVGRGAFDRVYPIYRTLRTALSMRFAFVENEPLQFLLDGGWVGFAVVLAASAVVIWLIARRGRRDPIEAALVAGLFTIVVHNGVDFGLETMGVMLPFMGLLGTVLGRVRAPTEPGVASASASRALVIAACLGLAGGAAAVAHASSDNFDALLKQHRGLADQRALLVRAQETHPLDYFYVLAYASVLPLRGEVGHPSPRLHALNRALRLCPSCELVHAEVARSLWQLRLRPQALLEWRSAIAIQPALFTPTLGELFAAGAKPQELATLAALDAPKLIKVAEFLSARSRIADAVTVLDQADALNAASPDSLLMRARLQVESRQYAAADVTLGVALTAGVRDPRLAVLQARLLLASKDTAGADGALAILDAAAAQYPTNLEVQRKRVELVTTYSKWQAAPRAIEGLRGALYQAEGTATEAHIADARIEARLGHYTNALGEYRIALADQPRNVALWMELGKTAETIAHDATARDAYAQAARLSPSSPDIAAALRRMDAKAMRARLLAPEGRSGSPENSPRPAWLQ